MHNQKKFISSRKMWDAQQYIVDTIYKLSHPMNTPFYAERELLLGCYKNTTPINLAGYDIVSNIIAKKLWFNPTVELHVKQFMRISNIKSIDDIQRKSIHSSINEKMLIVSGGPGRGKSSCSLKGILFVLGQMNLICRFSPDED